MTPLSATREEAPILLSLDGQRARKEDNVQEKMEIISKELVESRLFFIHFPSCHAHDEFLAFTSYLLCPSKYTKGEFGIEVG